MTALLPDKHVGFSESLLGLGALVLQRLDRPKTLDELWQELRHHPSIRDRANGTIRLETLSLAVTVLFCIGATRLNSDGKVEHETRPA